MKPVIIFGLFFDFYANLSHETFEYYLIPKKNVFQILKSSAKLIVHLTNITVLFQYTFYYMIFEFFKNKIYYFSVGALSNYVMELSQK